MGNKSSTKKAQQDAAKKEKGELGIAGFVAFCYLIAAATPWFKYTATLFGFECTYTSGLWRICSNCDGSEKSCTSICDQDYDFSDGSGCLIKPSDDLNTARAFTIIGLLSALITLGIIKKMSSKLVHTAAFAGLCACGIIAMSVYVDGVDSTNYDSQGYFVGFAFLVIGWLMSAIGAIISFFGMCC